MEVQAGTKDDARRRWQHRRAHGRGRGGQRSDPSSWQASTFQLESNADRYDLRVANERVQVWCPMMEGNAVCIATRAGIGKT